MPPQSQGLTSQHVPGLPLVQSCGPTIFSTPWCDLRGLHELHTNDGLSLSDIAIFVGPRRRRAGGAPAAAAAATGAHCVDIRSGLRAHCLLMAGARGSTTMIAYGWTEMHEVYSSYKIRAQMIAEELATTIYRYILKRFQIEVFLHEVEATRRRYDQCR